MTSSYVALITCVLLLSVTRVEAAATTITVEAVHGHCVGCVFKLGRLQFVNRTEGWAVGFVITVGGSHVSQWSTLLHTSDGGRKWVARKSVETYGLDVEPTFWFIDVHRGWLGWPRPDGEDRLMQTSDAGRTWRNRHANAPGLWVHLRFFDEHRGYAAVSTMDGARFAVTTDGGATWKDQLTALSYPDVMQFMDPKIGWLGGATRAMGRFTPRILRTLDGGLTWRAASFPDSTYGNPHDLFFVDPDHGWLILWNTGANDSVLLKTTDGGQSWQQVLDNSFRRTYPWLKRVVFLSDLLGFLFVQAAPDPEAPESSREHAAVLCTRDGGQTWQPFDLPGAVQSCQVVQREIWCSSGIDVLKIRSEVGVPAKRIAEHENPADAKERRR